MARKTIKQRISLDGGKEIEGQLKQLGEVGEKAFDKIRKAAAQADFAKFGKSLDAFSQSLQTVGKRLALAFAGATTVATAAAAGVASLAKSGADAADAAGRAAQAAGLQIDAYGRLAFAASQANVSSEEFGAAMSRLNRAIGEAAAGGKGAGEKFAALGVSIKDAQGRLRPTEAIVHDLANAFSRMPNGAKKSAAAIDLFGKSGAQLLPFLNEGRQGLIDLGAQAERLGIVFTAEQAKIADAMGDTLDEVTSAAQGIGNQIGLLFAPTITAAAARLRDVLIENREAILGFARNLADTALPVIEDFISALAGDDEAVRNVWILEWRDAAVDFGKSVKAAFTDIVIPALSAFKKVLDTAAEGMRIFTGIDIGGTGLAITLALGQATGAFTLLYNAIRLVISGLQLFRGHPVIAALSLIGAGAAYLYETQSNAAIAANRHKEAMDALDEAIARVKAGVPGAAAEFNKLAQEHIKAAQAAIENARAQVEVQKQALAAAKQSADLSAVGDLEKRLGTDIDNSQRRLDEFQQQLKARENDLLQLQQKIASASGEAVKAAAEPARATGAAVAEATQKVEELGKTITVHSSDGGKLIQQTFTLVDGVARAAEQSKTELDGLKGSAEAAGQAVNDVATGIVSVPDALKGKASPAQALTEGLDEARQQVTTTLSETKAAAEETKLGVDALGESWKASGQAAASAFAGAPEQTRTAVDGVIAEVSRVQPAVQSALAGGVKQGEEEGAAVSGIADTLAQPFEQARDRIAAAMAAVTPSVAVALTTVQTSAAEMGVALGDQLVGPFEAAATRIAQILERMTGVVRSQFEATLSTVRSMTTQLQSAVATLEQLAARAEAAAARARAAQSNASAGGLADGGLAQRFAGGGQARHFDRGGGVSGAGTSTSDSILSWLSDGEFVLRAAAVKKYGLDLLYALNGMRLPKDFLKGFADGGAINLSGVVSRLTDGMRMPRLVPAFADGGAVAASGGRPVNLTFEGQTYQMIAPEDVADRLAKHQARQGLRKAGKRPRR
ncbi:hypothetical protein [Sinorhizobium americanum]|uniref:Uncharacterized protein n=1 Tax=Sinorhizobium americanum TaxID=194963 RepID=A0A4R2BRI2_9HYPH|nr:hypothetical protein [Sinorhizobium americanum]TCN30347.1 hypothetical protein EV184_108221 [Sinorhizobium americanum]